MPRARDLVPAFAYLRTSSAANVGADKDSETRQRTAIEAFARRAGFAVVATLYDAAASGECASARLAALRGAMSDPGLLSEDGRQRDAKKMVTNP